MCVSSHSILSTTGITQVLEQIYSAVYRVINPHTPSRTPVNLRPYVKMASRHNYSGIGATYSQQFGYAQAVRCGNIIKLSGQAGWDGEGNVSTDPGAQIQRSLDNVEKALKAVDPKIGWEHVVQVRSYHINLDETAMPMTDHFKRLMPKGGPVWICFQVPKLLIPGTVIELEIEAYVA